MTGKRHDYQVVVTWTGNLGEGPQATRRTPGITM